MAEDRTITIDDVARLAGVSRATAGRVVGIMEVYLRNRKREFGKLLNN